MEGVVYELSTALAPTQCAKNAEIDWERRRLDSARGLKGSVSEVLWRGTGFISWKVDR